MKIAVLGGSFDPPHHGHLIVAQQVLELGYGEVWLQPCATNSFKKIFASPSQRLEMTRLACAGFPKIKASDFELKYNPKGDTIDTARLLNSRGINYDFIIGSDLVAQARRWPRFNELCKEARFLVFPRLPHERKPRLPQGFRFYPRLATVTSINSTEIRERVKKGKAIRHLVPEKVEAFISKNKLYA